MRRTAITGIGVVAPGGVTREDFSPDGRFVTIHPGYASGRSEIADIVRISDGHIVMHVEQYRPRFTTDGRFIVTKDIGSDGYAKYELATSRRMWTVIPSWHQDGFYMIMADGHVRLSRTRHIDLQLVRGFEVRQLDASAAKQFLSQYNR